MQAKPVAHPPGARYEARDASIRSLVIFGVGLAVSLVLVMVSTAWMFHYFARSQSLGPPASPFAEVRVLPPAPRLQVEPRLDLVQLRAREQQKLNQYAWVDKNAGIVRIPIDRAMTLLIERGLPVRDHPPAREAGNEQAVPVGKLR